MRMSDTPRVSVIIPAYNHEEFIVETISSVLLQEWKNLEIIVIDDASTDLTLQRANSLTSDVVKVIGLPANKGAGFAYNVGLAEVTGDYIMGLGSDDCFLPGKIQAQVEYCESNPDIGVLGTFVQTNVIPGERSRHCEIEGSFNHYLDLNDPENWIWKNPLAQSSVVIRSQAHELIGISRTDSPKTLDWELWLRAQSLGVKIGVLPEVLTFHRQVEGSVTHSNPSATTMEYVAHCLRFWDGHLKTCARNDLVRMNKRVAIERFKQFTSTDREIHLPSILEYCGLSGDSLLLFEGIIDENLEIKEYLTKVLEARDYYAEKAQLNQAER
jgi:glycosyltransferase involved in cell wall biosynthesis